MKIPMEKNDEFKIDIYLLKSKILNVQDVMKMQK